MSAIRDFFISAGKIAVAIVLSIIFLSIVGWGIYEYYDHRETEKNLPLATPRSWREIEVGALENARFSLSTVWHDGRLAYQLQVNGYPAAFATARDKRTSYSYNSPEITLTFLDRNGFKIFDHKIRLNEMILLVDEKGKGIGLSARGDTYVSADNYRGAVSWDVTWSL